MEYRVSTAVGFAITALIVEASCTLPFKDPMNWRAWWNVSCGFTAACLVLQLAQGCEG